MRLTAIIRTCGVAVLFFLVGLAVAKWSALEVKAEFDLADLVGFFGAAVLAIAGPIVADRALRQREARVAPHRAELGEIDSLLKQIYQTLHGSVDSPLSADDCLSVMKVHRTLNNKVACLVEDLSSSKVEKAASDAERLAENISALSDAYEITSEGEVEWGGNGYALIGEALLRVRLEYGLCVGALRNVESALNDSA